MSPARHPSEQSTAEQCAHCAHARRCAACFEELMRRFQPSLLQYLLRRVRSRHDAEDLLQETFLIAYRKLASYRPEWRFSTWLFTIAHRLAVSEWRKRRVVETCTDEPACERHPLTDTLNTEQRSGLWDAVERILEPDAAAALWLSYVESLPADQIGQVLGRNANAVRILLHRARVRLRDVLSEETLLESRHER